MKLKSCIPARGFRGFLVWFFPGLLLLLLLLFSPAFPPQKATPSPALPPKSNSRRPDPRGAQIKRKRSDRSPASRPEERPADQLLRSCRAVLRCASHRQPGRRERHKASALGTTPLRFRMAPLRTRQPLAALCALLLGCLAEGNWINGEYSQLPATVTHGMIIDAGSTGSRMHVYKWPARVFKHLPPDITYPKTRSHWTERQAPGLSTFAGDPSSVGNALKPLIDFAKGILKDEEERWGTFPVYLKATGGMRELPNELREEIMSSIRAYLGNNSTCPFFFRQDFARVVSGEEEAIYGWTAVNFLKGTLLPQSEGIGTVDPNSTWGSLDLGGASTQISFFKPDQDILANLFKLQIGDQKHWNVYGHSFLSFGRNSARDRYIEGLADGEIGGTWIRDVIEADMGGWNRKRFDEPIVVDPDAGRNASTANAAERQARLRTLKNFAKGGVKIEEALPVVDPCLPAGYEDLGAITRFTRRPLQISGGAHADSGALEGCVSAVLPLLRLRANEWCDFVHTRQCSIGGVYQPKVPPETSNFGNFYAFAGYVHLWQFLQLPQRAQLRDVRDKALEICAMDWEQLQAYAKTLPKALSSKQAVYLPEYCWMSAYVLTLLHTGYGFSMDANITVADELSGHKVGWALGAMLYEINTLPWTYEPMPELLTWDGDALLLYAQCVTVLAAALLLVLIRMSWQRAKGEGTAADAGGGGSGGGAAARGEERPLLRTYGTSDAA